MQAGEGVKYVQGAHLGAAILSGSDPPMSLETILPISKAWASLTLSSAFPESKIPKDFALTAFDGTCSRTSRGT